MNFAPMTKSDKQFKLKIKELLYQKEKKIHTSLAAKATKKVNTKTKLAKLTGSKFRWINEKLYTTSGKESFDLFQKNPEYFEIV